MMTQDHKIENIECTKGIPADVVFIGSSYDNQRMIVSLVFSHPTFESVGLGKLIPDFDIEFTKHYDK